MDPTFTPEQQAFRKEARVWLEAHVPAEPLSSMDTSEGFEQHRAWERELFEGGWSVVSWPEEYGGRGCSLIDWMIFEEEYYRAGAPGRVNQNGIFLLGPTIMELGTSDQKAQLLPPMASGEAVWCQGWSEPEAGSDLAAVRARADRDGDHLVLHGQKTWCSRGTYADWLFGLFRTEPDSERHRGLSFLVLPLDTPGVSVRPIPQLDGEAGFAEVFFDGARVPLDNVIGELGEGWKVAMSTVGFERGVYLRSPARFTAAADRLVRLYDRFRDQADEIRRREVADVWIRARAYELHNYHTVSKVAEGGTVGAESSLNKLWWSELDLELHETALRILGPWAELEGDAPAAVEDGTWLDGFRFAQAGPIYAGTNEIQRNIIADRVLQLPRD